MSKTHASASNFVSLQPSPLRFWHRGEVKSLGNVPPDRTLLDLLREDLRMTATKEGCGTGDCGACTVVVAEPIDGRLQFQAINSCIRPAHALDGKALWTAADLAQSDGALHPAQQAMLECHGSQCGFCTPGFIMSLYALFNRNLNASDEEIRAVLEQHICRCTGYENIWKAAKLAQKMLQEK